MNLILFEPDEITKPLNREDARARHIVETLKMKSGDSFDAGIINGARGKAFINAITVTGIEISFTKVAPATVADPIDIIVGQPRPQSSKRILHDASALGVRKISFAGTARSDPNYAKSTLWDSGEWRRHLIDGAQQAFDTRIPEVANGLKLRDAIADASKGSRLAFDNYEATSHLADELQSPVGEAVRNGAAAVLAFGPERGWDADDRTLLRSTGFTLVSLGRRVMRVETAIVSALAILRAELRWD